jgi:AcrR family transcriptional regulator
MGESLDVQRKSVKPRLNRDRILGAAMKLADEDGIKAVSMRKVAQELGVEAMSLYNHVASKDEIVDGIVDLVAAEIDIAPTGDDWKEAMRRRVISAHEVLLEHPWAASLWMSSQTLGGPRMRYADAVLRGFREGGFPEELTYHAFHVIQSHIMGFTMYVASIEFDVEELERLAAEFLETFPADEYPDLAEHIRQHAEPGDEHEDTFEFGLELVLDGLERLRDAARP